MHPASCADRHWLGKVEVLLGCAAFHVGKERSATNGKAVQGFVELRSEKQWAATTCPPRHSTNLRAFQAPRRAAQNIQSLIRERGTENHPEYSGLRYSHHHIYYKQSEDSLYRAVRGIGYRTA
jgi:hypothetical protein